MLCFECIHLQWYLKSQKLVKQKFLIVSENSIKNNESGYHQMKILWLSNIDAELVVLLVSAWQQFSWEDFHVSGLKRFTCVCETFGSEKSGFAACQTPGGARGHKCTNCARSPSVNFRFASCRRNNIIALRRTSWRTIFNLRSPIKHARCYLSRLVAHRGWRMFLIISL